MAGLPAVSSPPSFTTRPGGADLLRTIAVGQRLPVIDHRGRRHGTVEVVRIAVMPFGEVDAGSVEEHEAGVGPEAWREAQRDYYDRCREQVATLLGEPDWRLTDAEPLVVLRFRLVDAPA